MTTTWRCPLCRTENTLGTCLVCGGARPSADPAPEAPVADASTQPLVPVVSRQQEPAVPGQAGGGHGEGSVAGAGAGPEDAAGARPGARGRMVLLVAAGVVAVLVAGVVGAVIARSAGQGDEQVQGKDAPAASAPPATPARQPTTTTSPEPRTVETAAPASGVPAPVGGPRGATPAPPTTAVTEPAQAAPVGRFPTRLVFEDPRAQVQIRLPAVMVEEVSPSDGEQVWTYGGVSFTFGVDEAVTVADAQGLLAMERDRLRDADGGSGPLPTETYGQHHGEDAAAILSGFDGDEIVYYRQKIRCGDLHWYRLRVSRYASADETAMARQIPEDLYSTTAEGDAMGGVRAAC